MEHQHEVKRGESDVLWAMPTGLRIAGPRELTIVSQGCPLIPSDSVVTVDVEVRDGRPHATRVEVTGDDIPTRILRSVQVTELVRRAMRSPENEYVIEWVDAQGKRRAWGDLSAILADPELPIIAPDAFWWAVGRLLGLDPTKFLAERLGITRQAAAQRVVRARDRGELPETTQGAR